MVLRAAVNFLLLPAILQKHGSPVCAAHGSGGGMIWCSPTPVAHVYPRKCGWEQVVGGCVPGQLPFPSSSTYTALGEGGLWCSDLGKTSAQKLTPRIVKIMASVPWM